MNHISVESIESGYPQLARLQLSPEVLATVAQQGTVQRETRGPGGSSYFKLRYRLDGKQRVKYLGADLQLATEVAQELESLQRAVRQRRELRSNLKQARRVARQVRRSAAGLLENLGYRFHGGALRKKRTPH